MLPYIKAMLKSFDTCTVTLPLEDGEALKGYTLQTLLGTLRCILQTHPKALWLEHVLAVLEILEEINKFLFFLAM